MCMRPMYEARGGGYGDTCVCLLSRVTNPGDEAAAGHFRENVRRFLLKHTPPTKYGDRKKTTSTKRFIHVLSAGNSTRSRKRSVQAASHIHTRHEPNILKNTLNTTRRDKPQIGRDTWYPSKQHSSSVDDTRRGTAVCLKVVCGVRGWNVLQ